MRAGRLFLLLLGFALLLILGPPAIAFDIVTRVDLGLDDQQTTATGWNNVAGAAGSEPAVNLDLVNSNGQRTFMNLRTVWSPASQDSGVGASPANYNGPFPSPALDGLPASALADGVYVRDGRGLNLFFENLPLGGTYDFLIYGATATTGDYSLFTAFGSSTLSANITPLVNNGTKVAAIIGATPDAMRRIRIQFEGRRPDGSLENPSLNDDAVGRLNFIQMVAHLPNLSGDYNSDGIVDAGDYVVWRNTLGSTTDLRANGNNTGASMNLVDAADYAVWKSQYGNSYFEIEGAGGMAIVPEPALAPLLLVAALASLCKMRVQLICPRPSHRAAGPGAN